MQSDIIDRAIAIIGDATPLRHNCGDMCNRSCCTSEGYMLVMPGEMARLDDRGYTFKPTRLGSYGAANLVTCDGTCSREDRPYSCMIFPLAPKIIDDTVYVRLDARGRPTCPLCHMSMESLSRDFIDSVKKSLAYLYSMDETRDIVIALSTSVDMFEVPFL